MKLTAKTCPAVITAEAFLVSDHSNPRDTGALLTFAEWVPGKRKEIQISVTDQTLRCLSDLIEKTAQAREARAKYLRRQ